MSHCLFEKRTFKRDSFEFVRMLMLFFSIFGIHLSFFCSSQACRENPRASWKGMQSKEHVGVVYSKTLKKHILLLPRISLLLSPRLYLVFSSMQLRYDARHLGFRMIFFFSNAVIVAANAATLIWCIFSKVHLLRGGLGLTHSVTWLFVVVFSGKEISWNIVFVLKIVEILRLSIFL